MKRIRKGLAAIVIAGVFVYTFNVQYFTYFLSLVCDSAIECVSGGNEASARLTEELNTLSVSKFIRLTVNGKDIDLDDTDFAQDFYDDIVSAQETTEEAEGETGSGKRDNNLGFTEEEISNLINAVINEGRILQEMGLTKDQLGPAIAGAYDKTTGKIYISINDSEGDPPKERAPIINDRLENISPEIKNSYIRTKGVGSHAEIYAVNKLLLDNPDAQLDDIAVYVNRILGPSKPVTEMPFETCPHCRYILQGFNIISNSQE